MTDGGNDLLGLSHLLMRHLLPRRAEGIELHPLVAARDDLLRLDGIIRRRLRAAIPAVGIGWQTLACSATEKAIDRLPACFADDIPEGDLDTADGCQHGR